MQRFQSVKRTAVRFATVLLVASLAFFTGCTEGNNTAAEPGFNQNPGFGNLPGTATQLQIQGVPANLVAGQRFNVTVRVLDAQGNLVTNEPQRVTLTLLDVTPRGSLFGQKTMDTVDGIAVFPDLFIDNALCLYQLLASAPGLASATSGTITLSPADPALVDGGTPSTTGAALVPLANPLIATIRDAFNNLVDYTGPADVVILNGPVGGAVLNSTVNVAGGIADFSALVFTRGGTYQLQLQIPGFPVATFNFTVEITGDPCFVIQNGQLGVILDNTTDPMTVQLLPNAIGAGDYVGLAIDPVSRRFFTVDTLAGQLVEIDPTTGLGTPIGGVLGNAGTVTDIAYDPVADNIVALEVQGMDFDPFVFRIDVGTGAAGMASQITLMGSPFTMRLENAVTVSGGSTFVGLNNPTDTVDFGTIDAMGALTLLNNNTLFMLFLADDPSGDDLLAVKRDDQNVFSLVTVDRFNGAENAISNFDVGPTGFDCVDTD